MGLFDGIKKALYDEVPEAPAKPAATVTPLVTNNNVSGYPAAMPQSMPTNMFAPAQTQPVISAEDKKKYEDYFGNLYNLAKSKSANYGEFLTNIETVIETDPTLPDANKFKMAFSFMKKKGVTKEALSIALTDAINIIENDRKMVFDADINKKNANIDSNIKLIADKKLAMQKLAEEIQQLENETETIKSKISTKTYLYNSFASQLIAKIKNDLAGIQSFIN